MIVIVTSVSGGTLRPFAPILLGGWVFVMIIVRLVIMYKVYVLGFRKQRQITGREIDRLEARIEDAQRKSGDKD